MVPSEYISEKGEKSSIIIDDQSVEIKENPTLILGFAGVGLLGPIIGNTMIEQIDDMKEIGFVTSAYLPPISVFYDGVLKHPFRIFYSARHNVILMICEVPFKISSAYNDLSKTICSWALSEVKVKDLLVFQGIPKKGMIDEFPVFYAAQDPTVDHLEQKGVEKVEKGIIAGAEATILNEALNNRIKPLALFTPVYQIPTPEGAAAIIDVVNEIYDFNIDTSKLLKEGKKIKDRMMELAEKAQQYKRKQLQDSGEEGYTQYYQ
jgi:uncharacterized protein